MNRVVFLDAGPLSMVSHPGGVEEIDACQLWLRNLLERGTRVVIPEIADYELRLARDWLIFDRP